MIIFPVFSYHQSITIKKINMKLLKPAALALLSVSMSLSAFSQKIKLKEGSLAPLKNETSIHIEFTYDNMSVGKFDNEQDYINKKKEEYNKKEAGRGDRWAKAWVDDRASRFEPKFTELFTEYSKMTESKKAKYTLIFHTTSTEPGWNIGISRRNAEIDAEVLIVESSDHNKVIARITLDNSPGRTFLGNDYDTGERISEAYAKAGKSLGKYIK